MERRTPSIFRLIWRLGLAWLLVPVVLTLGFGGIGLSLWAEYRALVREGVQAETEIVARDIARRRDSDGQESVTYYLTHSFRPEGYSETITTRAVVDRRVYLDSQIGDLLPVTYVWNQPERNSLDLRRDRISLVFFGLATLVALLVSLGGGLWGLRRLNSVRRALRDGETREARVTAITKLPLQVNGRPRYRLDWIDARGVAGRSLAAAPVLALAHSEGDVIVVHVDPRSARGWWADQL